MNPLELIGFLTGIICVYLNVKENPLGWVFAILSVGIYFFIFYDSKLYADAGLQIFFMIVSIIGFLNWTSKNNKGENIKITTSTPQQLLVSAFAICFIFGILVGFLKEYTDSDVPVLDAFTTSLSIVAQVLLGKKRIENWILWIIADIIYTGLYFYKGLYLTNVLYLILTILAVIGYLEWRKKLKVI